jgi:hypothetical protein
MFLFLLPSVMVPQAGTGRATFLVCYGRLDPAQIKGYGTVILEPEHYKPSEIRKIKAQNDKVLAYISLGEVNKNAAHYPLLAAHTLGKNDIWDSYYLDLRQEETRNILLQIIRDGLESGYDGFFLDNLDNFGPFGPQKDQREDIVLLLKSIFEKYPSQTFLQNAGLDLIPETAPYIDGIIVESVASDYSFAAKKYKLRDPNAFNQSVLRLADIQKTYGIPVTLIEYAGTQVLRAAIENRLQPLGFDYFIGNIDLQTLPAFTR